MPFGNCDGGAGQAISLQKPLRRPEKRLYGDMSAEPAGPHYVTPRGLRRLRDAFPSDACAACSEGFPRKTARPALTRDAENFRKAFGRTQVPSRVVSGAIASYVVSGFSRTMVNA